MKPRYGPYSEITCLARPDGRTKEGRLLRDARRRLTKHLGGEDNLTALQRVLVERAAMLQLRIATLDARLIAGTFTEYDAKTYLAFSNSLVRTMVALNGEPDPTTPPADPMAVLRDHIIARKAEAA